MNEVMRSVRKFGMMHVPDRLWKKIHIGDLRMPIDIVPLSGGKFAVKMRYELNIYDQEGVCIQVVSTHPTCCEYVAFSKDTIAVSSTDIQKVGLWQDGVWRWLEIATSTISCLAVFPDQETLVIGSFDGSIKVWNIRTNKEVGSLSGHPGGVTSLVVMSDEQFASSGIRFGVNIWHVRKMELVREFINASVHHLLACFGDVLVGFTSRKSLAFLDLQPGYTCTTNKMFGGHIAKWNSLLLVVDFFGTITVMDRRLNKLSSFASNSNPTYKVAVLLDGTLALVGDDGMVSILC